MAGTRTLLLTELTEMSSGTGKHGPWTLYAASVTDADGRPIGERFKTFQALPLRAPLELEVERQEHEQHGVSYLLKRPGTGNGSGGLRARMEALERRVTVLETGRRTP